MKTNSNFQNKGFNSNIDRRDFIKFLGGSAAGLGLASQLSCANTDKKNTQVGLKKSISSDEISLAQGLTYKVLIKEGQSLGKNISFGTNNDFIQFVEMDSRTFLWVNHEAFTCSLVSNRLKKQIPTKEQYLKERELLGGSFFEIKKTDLGWELVSDSKYNSRLSGSTKIPFAKNSKIAGQSFAIGSFANCSGGLTPWNTILTCEENYDHYYGEYDRKTQKVYETKKGILWNRVQKMDPRHYGWVVEFDPKTKSSKKLTGLGRFAHECAKTARAKDGRVVAYSGDDKSDECFYKFISKSKDDLNDGELFVADLKNKKWVSLDRDKNEILKKNFKDQLEVLTFCREASKLVGGTPLARPEDIEIDPKTGHVLVALTNNKEKEDYYGSILKIIEPNNDYSSLNFEYETFLTGGKSDLVCPDNMAFDNNGNLWVTSDISGDHVNKGPYSGFGNNSLFVIPRTGPSAGRPVKIASAPNDAEFTGPCFSKDGKTLFLSVQHPGELSAVGKPYTSHWPNGGDTKPMSAVICIEGPLLSQI